MSIVLKYESLSRNYGGPPCDINKTGNLAVLSMKNESRINNNFI